MISYVEIKYQVNLKNRKCLIINNSNPNIM